MTIRRIRTIFTGVAGTPWYSNLYFNAVVANLTSQQQVDAVDAFWTAIAGGMDNSVSWTVEGEAPVIDEATGDMIGSSANTPGTGVGTNANSALPYMTQGLVRLSTDAFVNSRRVKGRIFVPGPCSDNSTSVGVPAAGYLTLLQTAADGLLATGDLVVWARPHTPIPPATEPVARAGTQHEVSAVSPWTKWAIQRSRRD